MSKHVRQVTGYLKPKNHSLFNAYTEEKELTKSEALNLALENFFDSMPEAERLRLIAIAKKSGSKNSY